MLLPLRLTNPQSDSGLERACIQCLFIILHIITLLDLCLNYSLDFLHLVTFTTTHHTHTHTQSGGALLWGCLGSRLCD